MYHNVQQTTFLRHINHILYQFVKLWKRYILHCISLKNRIVTLSQSINITLGKKGFILILESKHCTLQFRFHQCVFKRMFIRISCAWLKQNRPFDLSKLFVWIDVFSLNKPATYSDLLSNLKTMHFTKSITPLSVPKSTNMIKDSS